MHVTPLFAAAKAYGYPVVGHPDRFCRPRIRGIPRGSPATPASGHDRSSRSIADSPSVPLPRSLGSADHCNIERVAKGGVGERGGLGIGGGNRGGGRPRASWRSLWSLLRIVSRHGGYRWISRLPRVLDFLWSIPVPFSSSSKTRNVNQSGLSCEKNSDHHRCSRWRFFLFLFFFFFSLSFSKV